MAFYKKILILIIIILFSYIIWRLILKQYQIKDMIRQTQNKEGFFGSGSPEDELSSIKNSTPITILSVDNTQNGYDNIPINQFVIKASYNTVVTGLYTNLNMVQYVLSRGCRYLDFEIFIGKDSQTPCIAYTTDYEYTTIDTSNYLSIDDVFDSINNYAFSAANTPN